MPTCPAHIAGEIARHPVVFFQGEETECVVCARRNSFTRERCSRRTAFLRISTEPLLRARAR